MGFMKKLYTEIEVLADQILNELGLGHDQLDTLPDFYEENRAAVRDLITQFVEQQFIQSDTADWHPAFAVYKAVTKPYPLNTRAAVLETWVKNIEREQGYESQLTGYLSDIAKTLRGTEEEPDDQYLASKVLKAVLGEWHPKGRASLLKEWAQHLSDSRNYLQGVVAWMRAVAEALDK